MELLELKSVYRGLSRELHPGRSSWAAEGEAGGEERSIYEVNQAYESIKKILSA